MSFIVRRVIFYLVAAWVALTINFFIPRAMPGNAVQAIMAKFPNLTPSAYRALEAMLGVGHPGSIWHQYWAYLVNVSHLNFGTDVSQYPASVSSLLAQTIPWTITLVGTATVIAFAIGTALGIMAGWRRGGWLDRVLPGLMFFQAMPYFFLALILLELLAVRAHLVPIGQGYTGGLIPGWHWDFISSAIYHSLLPALTIVIASVAGWRHGGALDRVLPGLMFFQAMPYFFLALILLELLAVRAHLFPLGQGYTGGLVPGWHWDFINSAIYHSLLPAFTIVLASVAGWMLQMRNVMLTTTGEDYVLAAQAKGLSSRRVVWTYATRNAILPQLQGFGLAVGFVVSGAIVMEIVFSYPGIGLLLLNAVTSNDYPLMQAIFLVITFAVLLANLIVDVVIVVVDPRARAREGAR